jgi:ABC-type multidrug transport system ATPase subunit
MKITLSGIGKRFNNREWVIKHLDYTFEGSNAYAITGNNGSGKSTLTRIVSGIMPQTRGEIRIESGTKIIDPDDFYKELTYAAPYLDLIEEFTLNELLNFHFKFKTPIKEMNIPNLIDLMYLTKSKDKQIGNFSSGMKQRLKLGLAIFSDASVTILDEPTSNMDEKGQLWYLQQIKEILGSRLIIVASNQPNEYQFSDQVIDLNALSHKF